MSDAGSDEFPEFSFSFTEQDLAGLDASLAAAFEQQHNTADARDAEDTGFDPSQTDTVLLENAEDCVANSSFGSDAFDLDLGTLSAEELNYLDGASAPAAHISSHGGPSIEVELEESSSPIPLLPHDTETSGIASSSSNISPLEEFRSHVPLSVTDLCSPSWCEVQYEYGLRGRRSRPLTERPTSFVSSSGKTISPAVTVAQTNDVTTRQGLAVHKELEREIKFEELQVQITTDETRWALRLVNMIACLHGILEGFTREMPVFGILHDEVVVGIMDEVTKIPTSDVQDSPGKQTKRSSNHLPSKSDIKRAKTELPTSQTHIDRFLESPQKSITAQRTHLPETPKPSSYTLFIKDNKTRKNGYMPSDADMYSGRIQLMIYRRLLSQLLSIHPPYDFQPLWDKLGLDSKEVFPTKFLVQAQLITGDDQLRTACLDDLAGLWHNVVKESNIAGVSPVLELIYRLRPPPNLKGKSTEVVREFSEDLSDLEDAQLQWALQRSILPVSNNPGLFFDTDAEKKLASALAAKLTRYKDARKTQEESGTRRFKIIGTKSFLHNDRELDIYLTQVFMWWHGERRPQGVSLERSYRCSTCEYAYDCEWRAEKALEHSRRKE